MDRNLNFNHFLQERSTQLQKFAQALKIQTNKKGHQSLPKSIRRRAMSHNRFRIPLKMRTHMHQQLIDNQAMQKLPKCRKHIRKTHHLFRDYMQRHRKVKWLANHLWAAKRMSIVQMYGYKIPYTPNDKCFRSAYRHFRHNACLMDLSYLQVLIINTPQLPSNIVITDRGSTPNSYKRGYILNNQHQIICPVLCINMQSQWICWYHPASTLQINKLLWANVEIKQNPLQLYLLLGPQSIRIAQQALIEQNFTHTTQPSNITNPLWWNHNQIQHYIQKKSLINHQLITKPSNQSIKQNYQPTSYHRILNLKAIQHITQHQPTTIHSFITYFQQHSPPTQHTFHITNRSKYTHRRGNKLNKAQKKNLLLNPKPKIAKTITNIQPIPSIIPRVKTMDQEQHAIIASINQSPFLQGCYLICSSNSNCKIWRVITHKNVKAIGRRQYRQIMLETSKQTFPEDYPHNPSFYLQRNKSIQTYFNMLKRKPPQKRPNFAKINSPFPYQLIPHPIAIVVRVEMVSKGRCFEGSYIAQLAKEDYLNVDEQLNNGKVAIVVTEPINQNQISIDYKKMTQQEISKTLQSINTVRNIIGYITSGGYLFSKSKEGGIGFINKKIDTQYVLVRKPTSKHYYLAYIQMIESQYIY